MTIVSGPHNLASFVCRHSLSLSLALLQCASRLKTGFHVFLFFIGRRRLDRVALLLVSSERIVLRCRERERKRKKALSLSTCPPIIFTVPGYCSRNNTIVDDVAGVVTISSPVQLKAKC